MTSFDYLAKNPETNRIEVRSRDFALYNHGEGPRTAIEDYNSGVLGAYISHHNYDMTVSRYQKLGPQTKQLVREMSRHYGDSPSPYERLEPVRRAQVDADLREHGLDLSRNSLEIISDHNSGGALRRRPVYSVGGRAVPATSMNRGWISYYLGTGGLGIERDFNKQAEQDRIVSRRAESSGQNIKNGGRQPLASGASSETAHGAAEAEEAVTEASHLTRQLHGAAGILVAGVVAAGVAGASGANAAEVRRAAKHGVMEAVLPGSAEHFQGILGNHETLFGKFLNVADTASGFVATGATVVATVATAAAPVTGGASLALAIPAGAVALGATAVNAGVNLTKDGSHHMGWSYEGGMIDGIGTLIHAAEHALNLNNHASATPAHDLSRVSTRPNYRAQITPPSSATANVPPARHLVTNAEETVKQAGIHRTAGQYKTQRFSPRRLTHSTI